MTSKNDWNQLDLNQSAAQALTMLLPDEPSRAADSIRPSPALGSDGVLQAALTYLERGWRPIPIHPRGKRPLVAWEQFQQREPTPDEVRGWFAQWPDANVAILTGAATGIVAIDRDDDYGEIALATAVGTLPTTPTSVTAKGNHRVFAHPGGVIKTRTKVLPGIDVRGDGGYIVARPAFTSPATSIPGL